MFIIQKLLLLFCIKNNSKNNFFITEKSNTFTKLQYNNVTPTNFLYKLNKKKTSGCDERFPINDTYYNDTLLYNIKEFTIKKNLLNILINDKISIHTKIKILEDNEIKAPDLLAGGLMNNFNYEDL
jgi:hypothetical protein